MLGVIQVHFIFTKMLVSLCLVEICTLFGIEKKGKIKMRSIFEMRYMNSKKKHWG